MSGKSGVTLDADKGEVTACLGRNHQRMVLIASEAFVKMMEPFSVFGTAAYTMLYMMGQEKGRYDVLKEMEAWGQQENSFTKRQVIENVVHKLRVTGWGASRIQKFDEKREVMTVLVENNPLIGTSGTQGKPDQPVCHYFRGYWVGVVSEVFERKMRCAESKCVGMGDAYCEFKIDVAH